MKKSYKIFIGFFIIMVAAVWSASILMRGLEEPKVSDNVVETTFPETFGSSSLKT